MNMLLDISSCTVLFMGNSFKIIKFRILDFPQDIYFPLFLTALPTVLKCGPGKLHSFYIYSTAAMGVTKRDSM